MRLFTAVTMFTVFLASWAQAGLSPVISWQPDPNDATVAGYIIKYGYKKGGPYPYPVDLGKPDKSGDGRIYINVAEWRSGTGCYAVCVSYDAAKVESVVTNEIEFSCSPQPSVPSPPSNLRIIN